MPVADCDDGDDATELRASSAPERRGPATGDGITAAGGREGKAVSTPPPKPPPVAAGSFSTFTRTGLTTSWELRNASS